MRRNDTRPLMNLVLVFAGDFADASRVVLRGRRADHVREVHRAAVGDELVIGVAGGRIGRGRVLRAGDEIEMDLTLDREPPPPLDMTLVLALPRP